jgi:Ran-binding protein 3
MKIRVRQISQGVEDLSWQNMQNASPEKAKALDSQPEDSDLIESGDGSAEIKVDPEDPPSSDGALDVPPTDAATVPARRDSDSDSGEKEKGLKRKFLERGSSAGPPENGDTQAAAEPLKRPRDDPDKDENPRETKRPSPPPEQSAPPPATAPKLVCDSSLYFFRY